MKGVVNMNNDFDLNTQFKQTSTNEKGARSLVTVPITTMALTTTIYTVKTGGSEDGRCSMSSCKGARC